MIETFAALAEPNRLRIVEVLRRGARPVGELVARLDLPQPQVSKHLKVLRAAGLVVVEPRAQQRVYALDPRPLQALDHWLEAYRALWSARFDALDELLEEMTSSPSPSPSSSSSSSSSAAAPTRKKRPTPNKRSPR